MGLDLHGVRFLLAAKRSGVSFEKVGTIGRQDFDVSRDDLVRAFRELGFELSPHRAGEIVSGGGGFADELFRELGSGEVEVIDASDYEGAAIVHDLNRPIPASLEGRFSLLIDGGSLEHVFHVSVGLENLMRMVRTGGHLVLIHPANNYFGHGFYQLSPDFCFAALSEENGYEIDHVIACERGGRGRWFKTADPAGVGRRLHLVNCRPVLLFTQAERIAAVPIFASAPQQHRYRRLWAASDHARPRSRPRWKRSLNALIKRTVKPRFNPKYFTRVRPIDLAK